MDNYIGRLLDGRYEILEIIGEGGMAVVYKAMCHRLNRLVAIKILKDEYTRDEELRRRFQAESQAVAMLSHPNIVAVYDVSQSGGIDYIVMELIDGITLKQYMERKGVLNWRETLHFTMQIAKALEHAHSRGIVHRDIKPHNIMVLKNGSVKVADFGIARISSSQNTLTREALGSVHYISPEQAKGGRVDNRSDLYSLGVVMYEMLTGRPPYDGESPVAVAIQHINAGAPMPSTLNPNIPGGLEQITMHAMCANADARYSSATEMLVDLEEFRKNPSVLFRFDGKPATPERRRVIVNRVEEKSPQQRREEDRARRKRLEEEQKRLRRRQLRNLGLLGGGVLVVIIAIIVLVSSCGKATADIPVPDFENMVYADLLAEDYPDLLLIEDSKEYSDEVEEGHIIRQSPAPETLVEAGTRVLFVVSLGKQSNNMPSLIDMRSTDAQSLLQSMELNLSIQIEMDYDDEIDKDRIISTDPVATAPLSAGQTVVLTVSMGPKEETVKVPDVEGETLKRAIADLTEAGLDYKKNYVDSDKAKDTVVRQSIEPGEKVAKKTVVTLEISNGPEDEEPEEKEPEDKKPTEETPQTQPEEPGPGQQLVTKVHTVSVEEHAEPITVDVICASTGEVCGETQELAVGENSINIALTGSGTVTYNVYVNNSFYSSFTVNFSE